MSSGKDSLFRLKRVSHNSLLLRGFQILAWASRGALTLFHTIGPSPEIPMPRQRNPISMYGWKLSSDAGWCGGMEDLLQQRLRINAVAP